MSWTGLSEATWEVEETLTACSREAVALWQDRSTGRELNCSVLMGHCLVTGSEGAAPSSQLSGSPEVKSWDTAKLLRGLDWMALCSWLGSSAAPKERSETSSV